MARIRLWALAIALLVERWRAHITARFVGWAARGCGLALIACGLSLTYITIWD